VNCKPHRHIAPLLLAATLGLVGCSKGKSPEVAAAPTPVAQQKSVVSSPPSPTPDQFACGLLTPEEAQSVQGEPFKNSKPLLGNGPGLSVSQCYFELPTPVNSIVVTVTRKGEGATAREPRENWRDLFYREHSREKEKEEGEEKGLLKVEGVGDEAFWTGGRVAGALYVLKENCYIRISVGGAGDQTQKIEKCKALAAFVLKRL
jgi:hypothetical protein